MANGTENLNVQVAVEGAQQSAEQLRQVAAAQGSVAGATGAGAQAAEQAAKTQDEVNAKQGDWIGILNRIHPALGQTALAMVRMTRVSDDLADSQINFAKAGEAAIDVWRRYRSALLLGGAVALVVTGINAIISAHQREKKALDDVTESIRRQRAARNDAAREQAAQAQELEDILDKRPEGGVGPEQAEQAQQLAGRLTGRLGASFGGAVTQAVGGLFGTGADDALIEQAAVAIAQGRLEFAPGQRAASRLKRAQRVTNRFGAQISQTLERERAQAAGATGAARREAQSDTSSSLNLEQVIAAVALPGQDPERIADLVRNFQSREGLRAFEERSIDPVSGVAKQRGDASVARNVPLVGGLIEQVLSQGIHSQDVVGTEVERATVERVFQAMESAAKELRGAAEELRRNGPGPTVVNQYQQGSTFNGPDAASRRARSVNGESRDQGLVGD